MGRKVDLTGQRFGKLVVLGDSGERDSSGNVMWTCLCDCGNQITRRSNRLRIKKNTSCGCVKRQYSVEDISGKRFGKLTAIKDTGKRSYNSVVWECLCDCGKKKELTVNHLRGGTKSCGCIRDKNLVGKRYGRLLVIDRASNRKNNRVTWNCLCDCGNRTEVLTPSLISGNTKSCGCLFSELVGENHPNYNPDLTDEERLKDRYQLNGNNMVTWRNNIYTRDNYTCQICNQYGANLNAHHLNGWNAFPEQRFDLDNGVTLCTDCHKEFHSQYGYGDNTREQFNEYATSKTLVLN